MSRNITAIPWNIGIMEIWNPVFSHSEANLNKAAAPLPIQNVRQQGGHFEL
jgi:hypothetical protein